MTCCHCDRPVAFRGLCSRHYDVDYRARRKAAGGEKLKSLPSVCDCGNFVSQRGAACGNCISKDNVSQVVRDREAYILRLYEDGTEAWAIASRLGVPLSTVYKTLGILAPT